MNSLERALVTKAGYANGWENVGESTPVKVVMFSARHKAEVLVMPGLGSATTWEVTFPQGPPTSELLRSLSELHQSAQTFQVTSEAALGRLLRRAAELAMSLPNQAAEHYAAEVAKIDASPPTATEALRLVKQRVGQNLFRQALMDYWGGACAVTGIGVPELLRAIHAKPWAECASDAERLNAFNGFLLCAHLDALFDQGLMTFDSKGVTVFSDSLSPGTLAKMGILEPLRLRWKAPEHDYFLTWHHTHLFERGL